MDIAKFILDNMLILVGVLYVIGWFMKETPKIKNWIIPWVLLIIGVAVAVLYGGFGLEQGFSAQAVTVNAVQGALIAGSAVFINQIIKQTRNRESESNSEYDAEGEEDPESQSE